MLLTQQRARETRGAAAAVDAEFAAGESADVESGLAQAGIRVAIFFDSEQALVAEREDVAGEGVALGVVDCDELESARLEQFDGFDCEPGQIDERGMVVEETDQRHEMQAGGRAGAVGQRRRKNLYTAGCEKSADLLNAGGVGAITVADQQRCRVEPDDVSRFSSAGRGDL